MNNQIRFQVYDGDSLIHETPWTPEATSNCALAAMTEVRKQLGGNYQYRIERTGDSKIPNAVKMYRYRITVGESQFYSKAIPESEKEEALAQINEQFSEERFPGRIIVEAEI